MADVPQPHHEASQALRDRSVVIVSYNFPPRVGGIEQLCVELARALHALGVEVHVVTKAQPAAALFDQQEPYAVHRYQGADVGLCATLAALQRQGHRRMLCMQWTSALWLAAQRALTKQPSVLAIMVMGKEIYPSSRSPFPKPLLRGAMLRVMGAATHRFPISHFTAGLLRELAPGLDSQVIPLGVDAERFRRADPQDIERWRAGRKGPLVLTLARLVPRKGVDTLLSALPALRLQHPDLHVLVAGAGPDHARLVALTAQLGIESHVTFLGRVEDSDLRGLFSAADLFVLLSRSDSEGTDVEGFGLVLLEAQAAGTPVASTRDGGMPDAFLPDVTGILVDAHDPADFAARAGALLADPERHRRMSEASLSHARTQSWEATARFVVKAFDAES